jgi:hypothetical protein
MPRCDFDRCHSLEERDRHIREAAHFTFEDEAIRGCVDERNAIENYAFFHGEGVRGGQEEGPRYHDCNLQVAGQQLAGKEK